MQHKPKYYAEAAQWDSVLEGEITMVRASPNEEWAVATTDSNLVHLLSLRENGTYSIYKTIEATHGAQISKFSFVNDSQIAVFGNEDGFYTIYDISSEAIKDETAEDFCSTPDNYFFTLTQEDNIYTLAIGLIVDDGNSLSFQ